MVFFDDLALIEVLLLLAAAVLAYGGVLAWWAIRTNDPKGLRGVLRGLSVPLGALGVTTLALALWGEMTWPFPSFMAGYNIFFFDVLFLMGIVLLAFAVSAAFSLRMQFAGLIAFVSGGVTLFYGWTGYTASPAFTKDPFDTLLLYAGFGLAGILALPATVIVDYYLGRSDTARTPWFSPIPIATPRVRGLGARASQPVVAARSTAGGTPAETVPTQLRYRVPVWVQTLLLIFPIVMALAGIAALWYFGTTLPGHLGTGPANAP
jgi:putative membrane protein